MKKRYFFLLALILFSFSCKTPKTAGTGPLDDGIIEVIFLQINDVYEIAPLEGGKVGGMARIATLRKQLLKENPNTFTVHGGDFLNPSLLGTIKYENQRIKGRQMVEAMNACGIDLVAFGNHEFDLSEEDLQMRLNESRFEWLGTNVQQRCGDRLYPFYREINGKKHFFPEHYVWETTDSDGTNVKIGFYSACLNSNPKDYVLYEDYFSEATDAFKTMEGKTDFIVGLTHLDLDDDKRMAEKLPDTKLIMGGHEHYHMSHKLGSTTITKADANAKTAYIHRIRYDKKTKNVIVNSELKKIDESIPFDPEVNKIVQKWNKILLQKISEIVANPNEIIYNADPPLDGREKSIRGKQTNLGEIITTGMLNASLNNSSCAIINSGSVRIDDQIAGTITAIDIFRAMPFGGRVLEVKMKGSLLNKVLNFGKNNPGKGAYLQRGNIKHVEKNNSWIIDNQPLNVDKNYVVALNDFLLAGLDIPFLHDKSPEIVEIFEPDPKNPKDYRVDIRSAVVEYLKTL